MEQQCSLDEDETMVAEHIYLSSDDASESQRSSADPFSTGNYLEAHDAINDYKVFNSEQSDGNQVTNPTRDCYLPAILKPQGVKTGAEYENKGSDSD